MSRGKLSDPDVQARLRKRDSTKAATDSSDLKTLMAMPQGRRVMYRLMAEVACVFSESFHASGSVTSYNEGKRAVGLALMKELQRETVEHYVLMLSERFTREQDDLQLTREANTPSDDE